VVLADGLPRGGGEGLDVDASFGDRGVGGEGLSEDLAGEVEHGARVIAVAEGRRGGDGCEVAEGALLVEVSGQVVGGDVTAQRHPETPQEDRDVRALRAVVGVEFVEDEVGE